MTALFVAQMSWWIIFQITNVPGDIAVLQRSLEFQRFQAVERWQQLTDRLADSLRSSWSSLDAQAFLRKLRTPLRASCWIKVKDASIDTTIPGSDPAFGLGFLRIPIRNGEVTAAFTVTALNQFLTSEFPALRHVPAPNPSGLLRDALTPAQLSIDPATAEQVLEGRRGRVRMFAAEGAFFMLLILLGALSIHRALRQSVQLERQQQNFLAAVTHELKSPLASIRLFSETVSARELSDAKRREFMDKITEDVIRLEEMVDDVLEAATLSRETYHPQLTGTDLSAALQSYADLYRARAERAGIQWQTDIIPGLHARTDYRHLRRAVGAVLDNAIKYSQQVAGDKTIRVGLTRSGSEAIITVADGGVGLSPSDQKRVFERFFRAGDEMTRRVAGSGLGLYLAREIIDAHGGKVSLRSDGLDHGTTVEIRLPLMANEDTKA